MEGQLQFIQYQLWALIGLFLALVLTNVVCYLTRRATPSSNDDRFREMWDRNQIDKLAKEAEQYLQQYPNNTNALYYGARAMVVKRRFPTAKAWLRKLSETNPSLSEMVEDEIQAIEDLEATYER